MYKVELPGDYQYCPPWWKTLCSKLITNMDDTDELFNFIRTHGGKIVVDEDDPETIDYIMFNSKKEFVFFLLSI